MSSLRESNRNIDALVIGELSGWTFPTASSNSSGTNSIGLSSWILSVGVV